MQIDFEFDLRYEWGDESCFHPLHITPVLRDLRLQLLLLMLLLLVGGAHLGAEMFWFQEVGYLPVLLVRLVTQALLGVGVGAVTIAYFVAHLKLAQRQQHRVQEATNDWNNATLHKTPASQTSRQMPVLRLRTLLSIALGLSLLLGWLVVHVGQNVWEGAPQTGWVLAGVLAIAILIRPQFWLNAIALLLSLLFGYAASQHWATVLQFIYPTAFGATEPLFHQDIGFYVFALPLGELLTGWLTGVALYGFGAVLLTYLLSGKSLSQGWFPGLTPPQRHHLHGVGAVLMGAIALNYALRCYQLVYSTRGVSYGAGYTDVVAQLPADLVLSGVAIAIALYLLWRWVFWQPKRDQSVIGIGVFGLLWGLSLVVPPAVQSLVVLPNELGREQPYIQRTIALTRQAFGLEAIDQQTFNPEGELTEADLDRNALTIRNIRLWDQQPLVQTNRQLQQIRLYYRFPGADLDRYTLKPRSDNQQVLISAREIDANAIPEEAQTWVNRHLVYTHGYGFTVSPVNIVGGGGLPEYLIKDIGETNGGALVTSSPEIRDSIPIGQPRLYFGEITDDFVLTGTRQRELDFPSGSDNSYNTYAGEGGIAIGQWWRRALFSLYLRDWRILLTRELQPQTKVLFRRNINQRIRAIAPFLRYDRDPYLVAANPGQGEFASNQNYLYWMVDAYTTSDRYPYSDPTQGINYIRNSVKVVIDAYNGRVNFYVTNPEDPLIKTWMKVFPTLFHPFSAMPQALRSHIRYPTDFFNIQSDRLMTYHMTDPQVFYNREDLWQIPNEVYGSEPRPVRPYYLITSLPSVPFEEFILLLPYTPRERNNLVAWLAARSDGENYGRLLLYTFPKERLIYGTEQIEARINQDPVISQQISLWNRQGSRAIQGNLLVIPVERSLLYVEPIYLEATQNSLPTLVRVVVAYENRIVMAETLEQALNAIFQPKLTPAPAIIRPVEGTP